ncbi:MAG TPA: hypothetical protein VMW15_10175 [Terracidiphilus sp.]|nr:hypothetical protein [Terracidiphilus sp.]
MAAKFSCRHRTLPQQSKLNKRGRGSLPALICVRWILPESGHAALERLYVRSLPALGPLHHVELHGLTFLQTLETIRIDRRVVHEHIFTVLARNKAEAFRIIEPLHSTLFHLVRISWIELRWMNRSDHWQNLAWLGELLLTPGSALTLATVYHWCQNSVHEFFFIGSPCAYHFRNLFANTGLEWDLRT